MNHEPRFPVEQSPGKSRRSAGRGLARAGAVAGVVAAIANTAIAAAADAMEVELAVDGTAIPIVAFAGWTLVGALLGVGAARLVRRRERFFFVITVLTAISLVPPIVVPDGADTKAVLVATHLVAAMFIIPALGRRLDRHRTPQPDDQGRAA